MNLSDSFDEDIPDVIWAGSEFEVDIKQEDISCDIGYIATKKGGEFSIKVSWITPAGKKQKVKEAEEKTKEKLQKKAPATKAKAKASKSIEIVQEEDIWAEEDDWEASSDDDDWDSEDFDDEW